MISDESEEDSDHYPTTSKPSSSKSSSFTQFYTYLFPFLCPEGSKSLPKELFTPVISLVLATKYPLAKEFVEFAVEKGEGFKSVSRDVWDQLGVFVASVGEGLEGWNEMDACEFEFMLFGESRGRGKERD